MSDPVDLPNGPTCHDRQSSHDNVGLNILRINGTVCTYANC